MEEAKQDLKQKRKDDPIENQKKSMIIYNCLTIRLRLSKWEKMSEHEKEEARFWRASF